MATSLISNTVKDASGTAIASVPVTVRLMPSGGFRSSDFSEVARLVSTTTNASGFWSLALERNSNITPSSSWYEVTESVPDANGGKRVWNIAVGASDQTLLASLVTPAQQQPTVVPAGTVYLDQASADARYQAVGSLGSATPGRIDPDDAGTAGVATSASRSDHEHPITTGAPVSIVLTGTNAEGSGTGFARDTHQHGYSPPACRVFHSTTQSIPNNTATVVTFDSERYDTDTMHSTVSNTSRITFTTAGLYIVTATCAFVANTTGVRAIDLRLNGNAAVTLDSMLVSAASAFDTRLKLGTVYKFAAADYVEVFAFQTSGGALNVANSTNYSPEFSATWIGVG